MELNSLCARRCMCVCVFCDLAVTLVCSKSLISWLLRWSVAWLSLSESCCMTGLTDRRCRYSNLILQVPRTLMK